MSSSASQTLITGVYRAGTEYVTHCLNSHPRLSATMYAVNLFRFIHGQYDPLDTPENLERAVHDLADRLKRRYGREADAEAILARMRACGPVDYGTLYDAVMSELYLGPGVEHWAEKNQLQWREIPAFINMMPNGRALMILRDPRDVLASFKDFTYAPAPAYLGAVFNCLDAMQCAMLHARELPPERFLAVRFEDWLADPLGQARRVWTWMGLDADHPLTPKETWRDAYGQPWKGNTASGEPFDPSTATRRRETLGRAELDLAEAVCGEAMRHFGYDVPFARRDLPAARRLFAHDPVVDEHYRRWIEHGTGIQAFPTDPTDPANWRRRGKEAIA